MFANVDQSGYVNPLYNDYANMRAFGRYDGVVGVYDEHVLDQACTWMHRMFLRHMSVPLATHEEVIANFDGSTSCGWPYSEKWASKNALFESCGTGWLLSCWETFTEVQWQGIWKNFLKEELRPPSKDTRGITAAPIDIVYLYNRLFLAQNQAFYDAYMRTPSAVGISRDGLEWNALFRSLARFPRGASIDIKRFDSRMMDVLMYRVRDFRKSCLMGKDRNLAHLFDKAYESFVDTCVLVNGEVWQKSGGNPSGSVNTVVDNTLVNFLAFCYAFITLYPEATYDEFLRFVVFFLYGDDNTYTFDENRYDLSPERLAKVLGVAFGYEITTDGMKPVEELDFLSAVFGFHSVGGARVAVPVFDFEKMVCHIVNGPRDNSFGIEFQRIASLRAINCFEPRIFEVLDSWLQSHRHEVSDADWVANVPPLEVLQAAYVLPKKRRAF